MAGMSAPVEVLDAARSGDAAAFERLVGPYRDELLAHCYRMLGSRHDAEDAVQEVTGPRLAQRRWAGRARVRPSLAVQDRDQPLPDRARSGSAAASCRSMSSRNARKPRSAGSSRTRTRRPRRATWPGRASSSPSSPPCSGCPRLQRAVLILREVLGFSAAEVAEQLDTSTASVNSALQRARKAIDTTDASQQSVLRELGSEAVQEIVTRWVTAWQAGDVDAIVAMLADEARYWMPPLPEWYARPEAIRAFLAAGPLQSRWRFLPTLGQRAARLRHLPVGRHRQRVSSRRPGRPHPPRRRR